MSGLLVIYGYFVLFEKYEDGFYSLEDQGAAVAGARESSSMMSPRRSRALRSAFCWVSSMSQRQLVLAFFSKYQTSLVLRGEAPQAPSPR